MTGVCRSPVDALTNYAVNVQFCRFSAEYRLTTMRVMYAHQTGSDEGIDDLWIFDLGTNIYCTLMNMPIHRSDFAEFVACYRPENRHQRSPEWSAERPNGRGCRYRYEDMMARDNANLVITGLNDDSLEDAAQYSVFEGIPVGSAMMYRGCHDCGKAEHPRNRS